MITTSKFLQCSLLITLIGYCLSTVPNEGVQLLEHPFSKLCINFTCPNRHTCMIGIKDKKIPIYEEKCDCICSNSEACKPKNLSSTQCYCDKNIYGDECSSPPLSSEQSQCERLDWASYCQPHCTKPFAEQLLCNNMRQDPWDSCKMSEKCIKSYNDGVCDEECNNQECLFDGDDCQSTQPCSSCDLISNGSKQPICKEMCKTIRHQMNQTINRQLKSMIYLEVEFQASYGLAYINLVSLLEQLSLKFSVIINVAIGADMKPVMYSKYSENFSRITTTILFTVDSRKCITESCVVNPHQMANNLMTSSYLKKDTLIFKVVNANGHMLSDRSDYFSFENNYFLLVFVVGTVLTTSICVGSMFYTHRNNYWPNQMSSSSNSNISSQSSTLLHTENETIFHDRNQEMIQTKPTFSSWKAESYMITATPEDIKENLMSHNNFYVTMTPTNLEGESNLYSTSAGPGLVSDNNFTQPITSSSPLPLINTGFGNWNSLVSYSNHQSNSALIPALPYSAIVPTTEGVFKAVMTTMDESLYSSISFTLFKCHTNKIDENESVDKNPHKKPDLSKFTGLNLRTNTIIHDCIKNGIFITNEELLSLDVPIMELKNEQSLHPILLSVIYSRADWLDFFCNNGISLDSHDINGWRPVHWAAATNDVNAMKILHQYRANFEVITTTGETPLMIACKESSLEAIMMLLSAKVNLVQANHLNMDCVDIAIKNNRLAVLSVIYNHIKNLKKGKDSGGISNLIRKIDGHFAKNPTYVNRVAENFTLLYKPVPVTTAPKFLQQNTNQFSHQNYQHYANQPTAHQYEPSQLNANQTLLPPTSGISPPSINNPYSHPFSPPLPYPDQANPNPFGNPYNVGFYTEDMQSNYCDIQKRVYCPLQSNLTTINQSLPMDNNAHYQSNVNFKVSKFNQNQPPTQPSFVDSNFVPNMNLFATDPNYLLSTPSVDNFLNMVQAHMLSFSSQNNSVSAFDPNSNVSNIGNINNISNINNIGNNINNENNYQMTYPSESFQFNPNNNYNFGDPTNPSEPHSNSNR